MKTILFSILIGLGAASARAELVYDFIGKLSSPVEGIPADAKMDLRLKFDSPTVNFFGPGDYGFIELGAGRTQLFADSTPVFSLDSAFFSDTVDFGSLDGYGGGPGGVDISFVIYLSSSKRIINDPSVLPSSLNLSDFDVAHYVRISDGLDDLSYTFDDILVNGVSSSSPSVGAVPEPSSYSIFGALGLVGLMAIRSRRKQ